MLSMRKGTYMMFIDLLLPMLFSNHPYFFGSLAISPLRALAHVAGRYFDCRIQIRSTTPIPFL
jgi:hypothetical protein